MNEKISINAKRLVKSISLVHFVKSKPKNNKFSECINFVRNITILRTRNFVIGLGCAAPLIGSSYIIPRHTLPFDFYDNYFIFLIIHIYHIFTPKASFSILPTWLIKGLSIFILITIAAVMNNPGALGFSFIKQVLGATFSASSYFIIFKLAGFNVFMLFKRYLNFAFHASILALIEEVLHLAGIHVKAVFFGPLGAFRVGGLSGEPYNLSLALFPALFFYLINFSYGFRQVHETHSFSVAKSIIIGLAFLLTFSSTGYAGLFIAFLFIGVHRGFFSLSRPTTLLAPVFVGIVYFVFSGLLSTDATFENKFDDGINFLKADIKNPRELDGMNSSSFALVSNYHIALEGFKENPVVGIGLGNYETLFHRKFKELFGLHFELKYGKQNFNDANSMFLRLMAETGIIGLGIFLYFIFSHLIKHLITKDWKSFYLIVINHGVFILMLMRLLRCGNYLSDGMFFFILLFYFSRLQFQRMRFDPSKKKPSFQSDAKLSASRSEKITAPL